MARKTHPIRKLIDEVNKRNKHSTCERSKRDGWNSLLESVLHDAGVYAGFGYYEARELPNNHPPGIIRDPSGGTDHTFPDESRVFYYVDPKLTRK